MILKPCLHDAFFYFKKCVVAKVPIELHHQLKNTCNIYVKNQNSEERWGASNPSAPVVQSVLYVMKIQINQEIWFDFDWI